MGQAHESLRPAPNGEGQDVVTTPKKHSWYPIRAAPLWRRPGKAVTSFLNSLIFFDYLMCRILPLTSLSGFINSG